MPVQEGAMCIYQRATSNNDVGATAAVPRQVRGRTRLSGSRLRALLRQLHCAPSRLLHAALNKRENSWTRVRLLRGLLETTFSLICFAVLGVSLSAIAAAQMVMDIDHEAQVNRLHPDDSPIITCPDAMGNKSLPAGNYGSNLHVVGECIADGTQGGGIYKYHWVFIHNGGALTFQDKKLDLYASSILVMNGGALRAPPLWMKTQ